MEKLAVPSWPVKNTAPLVVLRTKPSTSLSAVGERKLVLDTAAFIARIQFAQYGSEFYTIPEVLKEVRDGRARAFLDTLPMEIKVREPSVDAYTQVVEFSKKTGDFPTLSKVDLKVLALAYMLEVEAKGSAAHLRTEPITAELVAKPNNVEIYLPKQATDKEDAADSSSTTAPSSDKTALPVAIETSTQQVEGGAKIDDGAHEESEEQPDEDENDDKELVGMGDFDSDDDDDGWITTTNLKDYKRTFLGREEGPADGDKDVRVSTLTADFAMQNVLLQLGLHLTSSTGVTIKRLQTWVLRCFTCSRVCKDLTKMFCPVCGHPTLQRARCSIGSDGKLEIEPPKAPSTRGTIYTPPVPKSNKRNDAFILSSAELPRSAHTRSGSKQGLDDAAFAEVPRHNQGGIIVGHGRRNPNATKSRPSKSKKRRV